MATLRLDQIAEKTGGIILQGSPSLVFSTFNIDSRLTQPEELFFALKAERDGHEFVTHAFSKGARGAVISSPITAPWSKFALVKVEDTLLALQELARQVLLDFSLPVVAITGSNGKTTTKEFTSALLGRKYRVLKSEANFNNLLGLPLTLLKLTAEDEIAVLEMGMSTPGEIRRLTEIAPPQIAVITNINPVHLEFFPSLEDIALAKKEILEGTAAEGTAVLNGDDPLVEKISKDWKGRKIFFGLSAGCEVRASRIEQQGKKGMSFDLFFGGEKERVHFPFFYPSFLYNLLAAAGVSYSLGISVEEVGPLVADLKHFPMRGTPISLAEGITLIDDSYNSNPRALEQALEGLARIKAGRKVAVLGDMLELGKKETEYHFQAGKQVATYGWDLLVCVGQRSRHMAEGALASGMRKDQIFTCSDSEEAAEKLTSLVSSKDLILVKGSRGMKMEKVVNHLKEKFKKV
ncbi:MAG: UDP-N-acetylmuramoyl-tripeptide--D-alanyl-D-alanine ligase [Candidatus Aminicenantales bacterium]